MKAIRLLAAALALGVASPVLAAPKAVPPKPRPAPAAKQVAEAAKPVAKPAAQVAVAETPAVAEAPAVGPDATEAPARPRKLAELSLADALAFEPTARPAPRRSAEPANDAGNAMSALDLGADYGMKRRASALPDVDAETFEAKALSENQVGAIVRERAEDLEYCWLRLPPKQRVVSAAILHLSIEASGKVAAVEVNGDMPAGVGKCITKLAGRWTFPAADTATEVDHGIMLTTTSQKVR